MDTVTPMNPSAVVADPTDDECPGCGATVQAWTCPACGLDWAVTVVNPTVRAALDVIGLLPTPNLRSAALLAVLRAEVRQRSGKEYHPMPDTVCLPATELISIDAMASVATAVWWCQLCGDEATAPSRPAAHSDAVEHLTAEHHATIGTAPD